LRLTNRMLRDARHSRTLLAMLNRFFIPGEWIHTHQVTLSGPVVHQISTVLRLAAGACIAVLDNSGAEYAVRITEVKRDRILGEIVGERRCETEARVRLTLFQSLLKREKFEWVLQKCTEVGVARIVPVVTRRTVVRSPRIKADKLARWRSIVREAAEQSGRGLLPVVEEPLTWREGLSKLSGLERTLIAEPHAGVPPLRAVLQQADHLSVAQAGIIIGPEGGFDPDELEQAERAGAVAVGLGPRILRTETAAVVASAIMLYAWGQL